MNSKSESASEGRKTTRGYWESTHSGARIRIRLPSKLNPATLSFMSLMREYVRPGMSVLEVGCAPGKYLAWIAKVLQANVSGIDYSPPGIETTRALCGALGIRGDFRCEDLMETTFAPGLFDVVYSMGVIEHFDDPRPMIRKHMELLKPNGTAVISIPNYGGVYGQLHKYFDPENLALHNTSIMSLDSLRALAPEDLVGAVRTFPYGRIYSLVGWRRKLPGWLATLIELSFAGAGLVQPLRIPAACPWLVLEMKRTSAPN